MNDTPDLTDHEIELIRILRRVEPGRRPRVLAALRALFVGPPVDPRRELVEQLARMVPPAFDRLVAALVAPLEQQPARPCNCERWDFVGDIDGDDLVYTTAEGETRRIRLEDVIAYSRPAHTPA